MCAPICISLHIKLFILNGIFPLKYYLFILFFSLLSLLLKYTYIHTIYAHLSINILLLLPKENKKKIFLRKIFDNEKYFNENITMRVYAAQLL